MTVGLYDLRCEQNKDSGNENDTWRVQAMKTIHGLNLANNTDVCCLF